MATEKKPLALYLHVPFCRSKCRYCDFCSFPRPDAETVTRYVSELARRLRAADAQGYEVGTVYFGGGTPTLLPPREVETLLSAARVTFSFAESPEITLECNPGTVTEDSLRALHGLGVNRLSIGLQSADENELRVLGRIHSSADFSAAFKAARRAGFTNLSADVMLGIPEQTPASFRGTLDFLLQHGPEHISAYGLKIEENTPFGRAPERLRLPDEDAENEMYETAVSVLRDAGLYRYEISNFARPGYYSRHNYAYWTQVDYLGLGLAAHSYLHGVRTASSRDLTAFLRGEDVTEYRETVTGSAAEDEYVMLRMRLEEGVSERDFDARFGRGRFSASYGSALARYLHGDFVRRTDDGYAFTTRGFRVSNYILSEVLALS